MSGVAVALTFQVASCYASVLCTASNACANRKAQKNEPNQVIKSTNVFSFSHARLHARNRRLRFAIAAPGINN